MNRMQPTKSESELSGPGVVHPALHLALRLQPIDELYQANQICSRCVGVVISIASRRKS
jgi:hypothetical protein